MAVKFFNHALFTNVELAAKRAVKESVSVVKNEVGDLIFGPKTGRVYKRGPKTLDGGQRGQFTFDTGERTHQASAPGEPLANDYGAWWGSLESRVENNGMTGSLITGVEYAYSVEISMNRPTLRPALTNKQKEIGLIFEKRVKEAINKS